MTAATYAEAKEELHCQRCGDRLNNKKIVWLNRNCMTGKYSTKEPATPEADQGWFPFGIACSKRQLREDQ